MPDPIDITDGLPVEQPPQEAPVETPEAPPELDTIPYRGRDGDFQIPVDAASAVAAALGFDNPAALINKLRMGDEADAIYRESREALRRAHQQRQQAPPQPDAYYQDQEARRAQQYRQPRPQYQSPEEAAEDPLSLIRAMNSRLLDMDQRTAQVTEYIEWQKQQNIRDYQARQQSLEREVRTEYGKLTDELRKKNTPDWKIPDMESLLSEAEQMGMFGGSLPPGEIVRRTYRMVYGDDIAQEAAASALQAARSPKARITVSTGKQVTPPQAPAANTIAGMEAQLGNMKWGEFVQQIPERR
jgi:hypothetical protein